MSSAATSSTRIRRADVFRPFLQKYGFCLLDGGLTTALPNDAERHVLWGHQLLYGLDGGLAALKEVHKQYLQNGAQVLGTLSYKMSVELLAELDRRGMLPTSASSDVRGVAQPLPRGAAELDREARELFKKSVGAALEARSEFLSEARGKNGAIDVMPPLVFGSVGPWKDSTQAFVGATDPNTRSRGEEMDTEQIARYYSRKLAMLRDAGCDGFAIETLAGSAEARIAAEVAASLDLPTLISFCGLDEEHTTSGERIEDCVAAVLEASAWAGHVHAVGVNCVHPRLVKPLVSRVKQALAADHQHVSVAVYPNSGEVWDASEGSRCWHSGSSDDEMPVLDGSDAVAYWECGADLVGGCCRVSPRQIGLFRDALSSQAGRSAL